jgi:hypothetical protein
MILSGVPSFLLKAPATPNGFDQSAFADIQAAIGLWSSPAPIRLGSACWPIGALRSWCGAGLESRARGLLLLDADA